MICYVISASLTLMSPPLIIYLNIQSDQDLLLCVKFARDIPQ